MDDTHTKAHIEGASGDCTVRLPEKTQTGLRGLPLGRVASGRCAFFHFFLRRRERSGAGSLHSIYYYEYVLSGDGTTS